MKIKIPFNDLSKLHNVDADKYIKVFQEHLTKSDFILGDNVQKFEAAFSKIHGLDYCVSCADGTAALYLAVKALELEPSDEVIVPANTWISTASAVSNAGAKVVFCDVDENTFCLSPDSINAKITKNTKAVIAVHMFGLPADMLGITKLCAGLGINLIEDCAQAHFAEVNTKMVGTFGDLATFSFFPGKIIGAFGDGGAVLTKNAAHAERIRLLARNGSRDKGFFITEGINSRLDSLQASILRVKLQRYKEIINNRRMLAERFFTELNGVEDLILPHHTFEQRRNSFNYYVVRSRKRDDLAKYLKEAGISTQIHYPVALPFQKAYEHLGHYPTDFPISYKLQSQILSLPFYVNMDDQTVLYLCESIKKFLSPNTTKTEV